MRIVVVANWWYRRGGLGAMMLDEAGELERRGHTVVPFAAHHPLNLPTPWSRFFVESFNTADLGDGMSLRGKVRATARLIRNTEAARQFERLIEEAQPDLVHLHNAVRQLSPTILSVARRRGLPVLISQHDYALICPQGQLLKGDRHPCTPPNCTRGNPMPVILHRCIRGRFLPSVVAATEYGVHRARKSYSGPRPWLVAPSKFAADALRAAGFAPDRIKLVPNGVEPGGEPSAVPRGGGHFLYAGRLTREKGLDHLLAAAARVPELPVVIAGDGPLRTALEARAPSSVRFVGEQTGPSLAALRDDAVAVVSPSIWYENAPVTVLEAMRSGRPTIATRIGGQAELIADGCGIEVAPRDPDALATAMQELWVDRDRAQRLGTAARARLMDRFTLAHHVDGLEAVYREARGGGP